MSLGGTFEVFVNFQHWLGMTIVKTSWTLPLLFCSRQEPDIVEAVHEVHYDHGTVTYVLHEIAH